MNEERVTTYKQHRAIVAVSIFNVLSHWPNIFYAKLAMV